MEPALKDTVGELTGVALPAPALPELRAGGRRVLVPPGVPPACLLPRVRVRALRPVVGPPAPAPPHLELVHPELVALFLRITDAMAGASVELQRCNDAVEPVF